MGVPRLFSWLAERYPLCQRVVDGSGGDIAAGKSAGLYPEVDNFYLDMNGIIHKCTHGDPEVSLTEEEMFQAVFAYIEKLFFQVRPRDLLYVAVDGVAPRAKMNQQRSRRFKSAVQLEKDVQRHKVMSSIGEEPPPKPAFDSNCITPGTDFMTRLSSRLMLFLQHKVQSDPLWEKIKVIYSGHEVPGEGEHKIQQYVRELLASRPASSQPIRHCMYGLDADLIVLGLVSHEPNFCLIFEDVHSAPDKQTHSSETGENFRMMYLSLLREYLDIEFCELDRQRNPASKMSFDYDLDRIIDDVVVLSYFVGNDFLPNIPSLYIPNGALDVIFGAYKQNIHLLDGYIQAGQSATSAGTFSLPRIIVILEALIPVEHELLFMMVPQAKHRRKEANPLLRTSSSGSAGSGKSSPALQFADVQLALADFGDVTPSQVALAVQMGSFSVDLSQASLALPGLDVEDRKFVLKLASLMRLHGTLMGIGVDIHVVLTRVHDPELADGGASDDSDSEANIEDESILEADIDIDDAAEVSSIPAPVLLPPAPSNESPLPLPIALANLTLSSVGASSSIEPKIARLNAIIDAIKEKAGSGGGKNKKPKELDSQSDDDVLINATIRNYYVDKLHLPENDATEWMKQRDEMCHEFIKGVQWVLAYYYSGVASWSWFYPFHYGPFLVDIVDYYKNRFFEQQTPPQTFATEGPTFSFSFSLARPFHPFHQLMAVLPPRSIHLIPEVLQPLMSESSPIQDFYPVKFASDMNGKKKDWEAVALIPFIDEGRLLQAMAPALAKLSAYEQKRNTLRQTPYIIAKGQPRGKDPSTVLCHDYKQASPLPNIEQSALIATNNWSISLPAAAAASASAVASAMSRSPAATMPSIFENVNAVPIKPAMMYKNMMILRQADKRDAIVLQVSNDRLKNVPTVQIAGSVLGSKLYIDWPYAKEAFCLAVLDATTSYEMNVSVQKNQLEVIANVHTPARAAEFKKQVTMISDSLIFRKGILLDQTTVLLQCLPLLGLQTRADGSTVKKYATKEDAVYCPAQLVVDRVAIEDVRFVPSLALPFPERYISRSQCLYVDPAIYQSGGRMQSYFGCIGTIQSVNPVTQTLSVVLNATTIMDQTWTFSQNEVYKHYQRGDYITLNNLARTLNINRQVLSVITSTVLIAQPQGNKTNIGLALKHSKKGFKVLGYTVFLAQVGWMFSRTAVDLIVAYVGQFPGLIRALGDRQNNNNGVFTQTELFSSPGELSAVILFLKKHKTHELRHVPILSEEFTLADILSIRTYQTRAHDKLSRMRPVHETYEGIYPHFILQSHEAASRLDKQTFMLGDRVVSTGAYLVPLGLKGIVIKIEAESSSSTAPAQPTMDNLPRVVSRKIHVALDANLPSGVSIVEVPPFAFLNLANTIPLPTLSVRTPLDILQQQPRVCGLGAIVAEKK